MCTAAHVYVASSEKCRRGGGVTGEGGRGGGAPAEAAAGIEVMYSVIYADRGGETEGAVP